MIPAGLLESAANKMLKGYVPRAEHGQRHDGRNDDDGNSHGVRLGQVDSNNYLDVRDARIDSDQGTIRVDRIFDAAISMSVRYSVKRRDSDSCRRICPAIGFNHDNLAQNGSIIWTRRDFAERW